MDPNDCVIKMFVWNSKLSIKLTFDITWDIIKNNISDNHDIPVHVLGM